MTKKLLVICPIGIGNFIMLTPALQRLAQTSYQLEILCLKSGIAEMAESSGFFTKIHIWDPDQESFFKGFRLIYALRKSFFEIILRCFPTHHWKFSLFCFFLKFQKQIQSTFKRASSHSKVPYTFGTHDVEQNHHLVNLALNKKEDTWFPLQFYTKKSSLKFHTPKQNYFVCHLGGSQARNMILKRLSLKKWIFFINQLHEKYRLICIPIGGPEEQSLINNLHQKSNPGSTILQPTKSLSDLTPIIKKSLFFMGNDSGLMHISVALKKKIIVFFGPSDEQRVFPYYTNAQDWKRKVPYGEHLVLRNSQAKLNYQKNNLKRPYKKSGGLDTLDIGWAWSQIDSFLLQHFPHINQNHSS